MRLVGAQGPPYRIGGSPSGRSMSRLLAAKLRRPCLWRSANTSESDRPVLVPLLRHGQPGDAEDRLRALVEGGEPNGHRSLAEPLNALKSVFERCEAGRYAGSGSLDTDWKRRLVVDAEAAVDGIEEGLP